MFARTTVRARLHGARTRRALGFLTALVVATTFLQTNPVPAEAAPVPLPPLVQPPDKLAPARPAPKGFTNLPDHALALAKKAKPAIEWPAPGTTEITVAPAAKANGSLALKAAPAKAAAPAKVKVQTYDRPTSVRARVDGPVMRISPTDTRTADGTVRLSLGYAKFADAAGGDFGARLTLVSLPECALTTPEVQSCAPKPLKTVNSSAARTLTADVPVAAAGTLLAITATEGSSQGNYSATSLAPSSKWSVAPSSGSFSWSYPVRLPPVPGGFGPGVSFSYNSQSIDGRTSTTNNQGSWIGEGFGYEPGYVERKYKPCQDDGHKEVGDLCWAYDNAVLSLNGSSSELIRAGNTWRLANDDGSKIERLSGAVNDDEGTGAGKGEHWKLTTSDGTQYFFGLNQLPGWSADKEETKSTWTVPVFGDDKANADDKSNPSDPNEVAPQEPCYNATFANAKCQQAWRWNLDYAVDRNGNAMTYFYEPEENAYALGRKIDVNGTMYDRGGYLEHIDYGLREGALFTTAAAARIDFVTAERCDVAVAACRSNTLNNDTKSAWPDVPFDRICALATKCKADQASPTFFTRKRLTTVITSIRNGATTYAPVDRWTLDHLFPDDGDGTRLLWLHTIKQDGVYGGGELASPFVRLDVKQLANRIRRDNDMLGEMVRPRLGTVYTDTGSQIDIEYEATNCSAGALPAEGRSTKRCFPVKWHGPGLEDVVTDWFHKYVVKAVRETDITGVEPGTKLPPDMVTFYEYEGDAAWRYPDADGMSEAKYTTWSEWRGYANVLVSKGDDNAVRTRSRHTYLQGMDGDKNPDGGTRSVSGQDSLGTKYTDHKELVGFEIETQVLDADEKVISKATTSPWRKQTASQTRSFGTDRAYLVRPETKRGFTALKSGGWRETKTVTSYDGDAAYPIGRTTQVNDLGDVANATDNRCSRTSYADNASKNIRTLVSRVESVSVDCATTPNRATQVLSDGLTYYDDGALGAAPTRGLATKTERLTSHNGTTATYQKVSEGTYDAYGRPKTTIDAKNTTSRFQYTETNGLTTKKDEFTPKIAVGALAPAEFKSTTEYEPAWGLPKKQYDWNLKLTEMAYDKLGRLVKVWLPDRRSTGDPSVRYTYKTESGKPVAIKTEKAGNSAGQYSVEYQIFDGFMRPRQVQGAGPRGRLVADTWYTSTGQIDRISESYSADGAPSDLLLPTLNVHTEMQTGYLYDAADRVTDTITFVAGQEKWRTRTFYEGDRTHVQPPTGGVATTTVTDARGQATERWHYKNSTPGPDGHATGAHDTTKYTYTPAGQLFTVTDPDQNVWKYGYDQLGRKTSMDDPDSGKTIFGYDEADRLIRTTDSRGKILETVYDDLGRTTGTFEVTPAGRVQLTDQDWDEKAKGQLYKSTRIVNGKQYIAATMTMDHFYRPQETRYVIPDDAGDKLKGTYQFFHSYNTDGTQQGYSLPTTVARPGESVVYGYDNLQRVKTITSTDSTLVTDVKYTDAGVVTRAELSTGHRKTAVSLGYERGTMRLSTMVLSREAYTTPTNPEPDRPADDISQKYRYDDAGNVLWVADNPATGQRDTQCFTYDYLNRMTDAYTTASTAEDPCQGSAVGGVAPYHHSYTYDLTGNRKTETIHAVEGVAGSTRTYSYPDGGDSRPHGLNSITEVAASGAQRLYSYEYDQAGNTKKRTKAGEDEILAWDAEGHLESVTAADGKKTSFVYSPAGDRLVRKEPAATTLYLPGLELRMDNATGAVQDTRYFGLAAGAVAVKTAGGIQFQIADRNGTGQAAVDAKTGDIQIRRSTPFGTQRGTQPAQWAGEKGFVGGTKDSTTGLTHLGAREYEPETGRFISVDPLIDLSDPQRMNAYAYANNSPITYSDPGGEKFCSDDNCGAGADWVDTSGNYHEEEGHNDGCGGCSGATDPTVNDPDAGTPPDVKRAKNKHEQNKKKVIAVAKQLGKILMDELGITDAVDCFTKGDIGGCAATALNVIASLVGGVVGKLAARYWNRLGKLKKLAQTLWDIGARLKTVIGDFLKSRKAVKAAEKAADCGLHSFKAGTLVLMADGSHKPIEDIDVGDKVMATDPDTGETAVKTVTATHVNQDEDLTNVTVKSDNSESLLETTEHHPFWNVSERSWTYAGDLERGDVLESPQASEVVVSAAVTFRAPSIRYDLTVDDIHTYYVLAGKTPVLVHNCGDTPPGVSCSCFPATGAGPNVPPIRIEGPWTLGDIGRGAHGLRPRHLGDRPEIHHADQMPGSPIHELDQVTHRGPGSQLHPNANNQGVTGAMRSEDTQLHWWYRSQEQGWGHYGPDLWYD